MKKIILITFCLISLTIMAVSDIQAAEFGKTPAVTKVFQEPGYGYSIALPADWVYETQPGKTIIFSGASGTRAYYSTVSLQNLLSTKNGGKYSDVDAVLKHLQDQFNTAQNVRISATEVVYYRKNNANLQGKQFIVEYTQSNERFKQWIIVIPRTKGDIFHTWFYTSPISQYNDFYDIAKAMLDSWTLIE